MDFLGYGNVNDINYVFRAVFAKFASMSNKRTVKMKRIVFIALILFPFIFISCDRDDSDDNYYYVKYEARINLPDDGIFQVVFNMPDGSSQTFRYSGQDSFSEVIGPVEYGFKARVYTNCLNSSGSFSGGAYARILVSRNSEPFSLKAFSGGDNYLEALSEYTVDY